MRKYRCSLLLAVFCAGTLLTALPGAQAGFREEGVALIEKKGPNAILFDGHGFKYFVESYMLVTSRTRCYNENGEPISFAALKFPCQAQIQYKTNTSGMPEAVSIQVEFYREDRPVNSQWNLPVMKQDPPQ